MARRSRQAASRASRPVVRWKGLKVLLLDDDPSVRKEILRSVATEGLDIDQITCGENIVAELKTRKPHVLITDLTFHERRVGGEYIAEARQAFSQQELAIFVRSGRVYDERFIRDYELPPIWGEISTFDRYASGTGGQFSHGLDLAYKYFILGDKTAIPATPITR